MKDKLKIALNNPIWLNHFIGKQYNMDGTPGWKITYYPIFENGKTGEIYDEPRVLVEKPMNKGIDFREVPIHYLK